MSQPILTEDDAFPLRWRRVRDCPLLAHCEVHRELGSTNSRGIELAADPKIPLPALVVTERQTSGRGRGVNRWWSEEGSLTYSLVIAPAPDQLPQHAWPLLSLATGLAVCDALAPLASEQRFELKWPNDVYCNGRKLCGVLIESPGSRPCLVIGVGINVNNSLASAPDDIRRRAASLVDETRQPHDRCEILLGFLQAFAARQSQLVTQPGRLLDDWRARCMLSGRWVELSVGNESVAGKCVGINSHGALLVETEHDVRSLVAGTVVQWR